MSQRPPDALTAHADAWEELGRIHARHGIDGAGADRVRGARLMASGLPHPAYNNADVVDPGAVDLEAVGAWYAERGVPWGVRVPAGSSWTAGRHLFRKRLLGLVPEDFVAAATVPGLDVTVAGTADLAEVVEVDVAAFGGEAEGVSPWLGPILADGSAEVLLARLEGRPVAAAYVIATEGEAGPAGYLGGVGVVPAARRRGIAGDVSARLVGSALERGVGLVHCHPDHGEAARVYERIGFRPAGGLDVYVDLA